MHPTVAFADVERALDTGTSAVHPAEAHGCLCGALCLRPDYSLADWLDEILPDADAAAAAADGPFAPLFAETAGVLARPGMEFEPLLPGDEDGPRQPRRRARCVVPGLPVRLRQCGHGVAGSAVGVRR